MRMPIRSLILALVVVLAAPACASLSVKQKAYATHQTMHSALVALDHAERAVCGVDPAAPNHCLASPPVITNAQHQAISTRIIKLYDLDESLSKLIVTWKPGQPVPVDVATLQTYVTEIGDLARAIKPGPQTDALIAKATDLSAAAAKLIAAFSGGDPLAIAAALGTPTPRVLVN